MTTLEKRCLDLFNLSHMTPAVSMEIILKPVTRWIVTYDNGNQFADFNYNLDTGRLIRNEIKAC